MTMQERAIQAVIKYVEMKGYNFIEADDEWVVAEDAGTIVIARVKVKDVFGELTTESVRPTCERRGIEFLAEHDEYVDMPLRFDEIQLVVCGSDRAMIRHEINCLH